MAEVRWSPQATADLDEIWFSIAVESPGAADRVVHRLLRIDERLEQFPEMAAARNDLALGLRAWPVGDYLILYRVDSDRVVIVRVIHGARDIVQALSEP